MENVDYIRRRSSSRDGIKKKNQSHNSPKRGRLDTGRKVALVSPEIVFVSYSSRS